MAVKTLRVVMTEVDADNVSLQFDSVAEQVYEKAFFFASQVNDQQAFFNILFHYQITNQTDPTSEAWRALMLSRGGIKTVGGRAYPAPVIQLDNGNYLIQWGYQQGDVGPGQQVQLMTFSDPIADPQVVPLNIGAFLRESNFIQLDAAAIAAVNAQTFRWGGE